MNWIEYKNEFTIRANLEGKDDSFIEKCLDYAKSLRKKSLPVIYDLNHFSLLAGISKQALIDITNNQKPFYRFYEIKKKSGGRRVISEPLPVLKYVQHWILNNILEKQRESIYSKAYKKKTGIKDVARYHRGQESIVRIDIQDFFPSTSFERVYYLFFDLGYTKNVSFLLASLCCLDNGLPQGAPTSPKLTNLILRSFDNNLGRYCKRKKMRYTRYSDDLFISGCDHAASLIKSVGNNLRNKGYKLNYKKTRVMKSWQKQIVVGVTVNSKLNAPVNIRKKLRQEIYYISKFGLVSHLEKIKSNRVDYLEYLEGIAGYIRYLNPGNKDAIRAKQFIASIK